MINWHVFQITKVYFRYNIDLFHDFWKRCHEVHISLCGASVAQEDRNFKAFLIENHRLLLKKAEYGIELDADVTYGVCIH